MKKIITCLAVALCSTGAFAQYYFNSYPAAGINPGSLNADLEYPNGGGLAAGWSPLVGPSVSTPAWSANQTIPFSFSFNGTAETSYKVSSTGVLTFSTAATSVPARFQKATLPDANIPDKSVCVWGIEASGSNDYALSKTFGTAPNRQHWVFFSSHALGGSGWSYWSIVLEETTNNIYIVDQRHSGTTGGVSMGIQINSTTAASVGFNVLPLAGTDPSASDNSYYEFIQGTRPANDVEMVSLQFSKVFAGQPNAINGTIRNAGSAPLLSYTLSYSVNGGAPFTSVMQTNIAPQATGIFTHPTTWNPTGGTYTLDVYTSSPNGMADANPSNDTIAAVIPASSGNSVSKNPLLEEFTTAPCQFCPDGAVEVEAAVAQTPATIPVGLHACFGTDAMTIPEASAYCSAFGSGAPTATIDRVLFPGQSSVAISRAGGAWRSRTATQATLGAPVDVFLTGSYDTTTRQVNVNLAANFVDYVTPGDLRVTLFVVEDHVRGIGSGYDQVNYYNGVSGHPYFGAGSPIINYDHRHVLRDVYPTNDAWGDNSIIPTSPALNTPYTKNETFTLSTAWDADSVYLVGFVSYYNANVGQRQVLNAVQVKLGNIPTSVNKVQKDAASLSLYPNPTSDLTNLELNLDNSSAVIVEVIDFTGKRLLLEDFGVMSAGKQRMQLNLANLASGMYFVNVRIGDQVVTRKVSVTK